MKDGIDRLTGNAGDFSGIVLKAAAAGDVNAVKRFVEFNPRWLNQEGPHGRTLLWEAVYRGRLELVIELIAMGADVNTKGSYYTPLLVELSPLAVARAKGLAKLVDVLEESGAEDDFYAACHRGDLDAIASFLATDPAVIDRPSRVAPDHPRMGFLPIHYAVAGNRLEAVKFLLERKAAIGKHLPLLLEWAEGNREMVDYLRSREPMRSPSEVPDTDMTPAVDRSDWQGFPPLIEACRGNHNAPDDPRRVEPLIEQGATINLRDHKGKSALHRASQAGFVCITELLLKHGAELEATDTTGRTPIFDASFHGRSEVLALLIERGADLDRIDQRGETAVFAAARGAKPAVVRQLLASGSDPHHRNRQGKTVADIVRRARSQSPERVAILELLAQEAVASSEGD